MLSNSVLQRVAHSKPGFEIIEGHFADGYLMYAFRSCSTYLCLMTAMAGSFRTVALPMVARALREEMAGASAGSIVCSAVHRVEGGLDIAQSIEVAKWMREIGVDLIDCSKRSRGSERTCAGRAWIPGAFSPCIFADRPCRRTGAVGSITEPEQRRRFLVAAAFLARARAPSTPIGLRRRPKLWKTALAGLSTPGQSPGLMPQPGSSRSRPKEVVAAHEGHHLSRVSVLLDLLRVEDVSSPEPGPDQVLVSVHAAGLNFPDLLIIQNKYQTKPALPFVPGSELAGVVKAVGANVDHLRVGDRVMGVLTDGAFAQECLVPAHRAVRLPECMDYRTGAAFLRHMARRTMPVCAIVRRPGQGRHCSSSARPAALALVAGEDGKGAGPGGHRLCVERGSCGLPRAWC